MAQRDDLSFGLARAIRATCRQVLRLAGETRYWIRLRPEQDSAEYYQLLDDIFRPYYSKLARYNPASPDCQPTEFLSTDWQDDELAGYGSFVKLPVGSGDCSRNLEVLREGMGEDGGVWLAGEHTSPPGGLGTVTGAFWSGEEVARRVAQLHGMSIGP
ncbi:hypothetical protein VTK73DRAFT_8283 [Phialemonium thermophilum]|uniref:Amine oxidase domain-containing protein n=1 Tax=Phialemonium thermophilum TaxID=223376 RepID=A0ABR3W9V4_9PEZI